MRKVAEAVPQIQLVSFRVGRQEFGIDVASVYEVLHPQRVTPVPQAPEFIKGVIGVRGSLIPVIDLRHRFEVHELSSEAPILIVAHRGERTGLIVDEVLAVRKVPESAVSAPPEYFRGIAAEFMRGIVRLDDRLVVEIDMDRLLSSDERIALEEADLGGDPAVSDAAASTG